MQARASYTGQSGLWHGAIKIGARVVWRCPHNHRNRDHGSKFAGRSACECAKSALRYAQMSDEDLAKVVADHRSYMTMHSMSPRMPWTIDFELAARDAIRAALSHARKARHARHACSNEGAA